MSHRHTGQESALELGRRLIDGWNAGELETVFATFDPYIAVRTDANWPERLYSAKAEAEQFWHSTRDAMGGVAISIEEEHDLGDRGYWRVHQPIRSHSGIEGGFSWSVLVTARHGKVVMVEFFIDDADIRTELDL